MSCKGCLIFSTCYDKYPDTLKPPCASNNIERNDSEGVEAKPGSQHAKLAIALMEKMESLSKTTTRLWDDHQLLNDIMDEWRSATGKR